MILKKFHLFQSKFPKNFNFFRQFHQKFQFSEKKSPKFRFLQVISPKISFFRPFHQKFRFSKKICKKFYFFRQFKKNRFFQGKFPKNFDFCRQFYKKFRFSRHKYVQLFLGKSHHFLTYLLYMVRYNNILRPVHDPQDPLRPPTTPLPKIWEGHDPPTPRIDAYVSRRPQTKGKMIGIHAIRIFLYRLFKSTTTQRRARVIDSVGVYTTKRYRQPYTVAYNIYMYSI